MQALEISEAAASVIGVFETELTIRTKLSYVFLGLSFYFLY